LNTSTRQPLIALTPGEPAGIGPDITLLLAGEQHTHRLLVIADPKMLQARALLLGLDIHINVVDSIEDCTAQHEPGSLDVLPVTLAAPCTPGELNAANAAYVLECLRTAAQLCLAKQVAAMVTGPVHKGIINDAGIDFTGHTEYLAQLSNSQPVMMLATKTLRVALVTTHLPLRDVSAAIRPDTLTYCIETLHGFLKNNCKIAEPEILVCGLNPHAGEGGHLGREEIDIIEPVINNCVSRGMKLIGPLPADTLFTEKYLRSADAVLAMYHDQGLPVLKYSGFGRAVNITLGLPFIRTSVDHGTALDLAGSGRASTSSLQAAIDMATELSC
jgi:4-hydroxythreonine-4-phosphate dehydrogenase